MSRLDETRPFIALNIAVMTVSDSRSETDDRSGQTLKARVEEAGHTVAGYMIVPDEADDIIHRVKTWAEDDRVDIVITTGGTGFTGRDVTPDALEPLFDKHMDGFSQVFHRISFDKIGTSTIQSRATAGLIGTTFGRNDVNIANFQLGRNRPGGDAIALLYLDAPLPAHVLEELRSIPEILSAKPLEFDV